MRLQWIFAPALALLAGCYTFGTPGPVPVTPPGARATWGGLGVGAGTSGFLFQGDLSQFARSRLLRGRFTAHSNLGGGWNPDQPPASLYETSLMIGGGAPCCGSNWMGWTLGGGFLRGSRGWAPADEFQTVGLAGDAFLVSARAPHLALSASANVNPRQSFASLSLSILIGSMPFSAVPPPRRRF